MKRILNVFFLSICILCLASAVSQAKENPVVQADYQIQPSSVFDITYVVFIWTPVSTIFDPRYIDQFEFKAGDVFSAYTTKHGELTGTWIESEIGNGTWFQAWVEKAETSTTTTTPAGTTTTIPQQQSTGNIKLDQMNSNALKYDINIWGISLTPPDPLQNFSAIFGYGAYLGANAFFIGFASVPTELTCRSIVPNQAEQGDNLTVEIGCSNSNFLSAGTIDVSFSGNGITVGDPSVLDNSTITVAIEIADNAEISPPDRTVNVIVDGVSAPVATKFKVLENTN